MEGDWQPANALEQGLVDAVRRQDQHAYLALLSGVPLLVLVRQDGTGRIVDWLTSTTDSQTFLLGYTSPEALAAVAAGREAPYLTATIEDLAERWPDPRWWLAVNSGLPIEGLVSPAYLNSLVQSAQATASTVESEFAEPESALPEAADPVSVDPVSVESETAEWQPEAAESELLVPDIVRPKPTARFAAANSVERDLLDASRRGDTDSYLRTLLSTEVLVPMADGHSGAAGPGWRTVEAYGEPSIAVFTSWERLSDRLGDVPFRTEESLMVIRDWPDPALALAVNPGTPVGATLPGPQVLELAQWAVGAGLIDLMEDEAAQQVAEPDDKTPDEETPIRAVTEQPEPPTPEPTLIPEPVPTPESSPGPEPDPHADWLQKVLPHDHVGFYRQRRYHMVSGHVHRIRDVGQVSPAELYRLLGLDGPDSGFGPNDPHVHVIRWPAHGDGRYGDPDRPIAAGQVRQSRLAAVPLPHGALLCRVDRDAGVTVVASYNADHREWRDSTGGESG